MAFGGVIRELKPADHAAWLPLWQGYLEFYRETLDEETNALTFKDLSSNTQGMFAYVAEQDRANVEPLGYKAFLVAVEREACARYGRDDIDVPQEVVASVAQRDWPGNVRELRNAADRLVLGLDMRPGDGGALASWAGLTGEGSLFGHWKDHLDRGFMQRHRMP